MKPEDVERSEAQRRLWDAAATLEQKNLELRASEARFRRLADANIIGICLGDHAGHLYEANDYFLNLVGYPREDLEAGRLSWIDLTPPDHTATALAAAREVIAHRACKPYETEYLRSDGSRVPVQVGVVRLEGSQTHGIAFVLDLTDHHRMRRELAHAQKMESIGQLAAGIAHEINTPTQYVSDNVRFLDDAFRKLQPLMAWYRDRMGDAPAAAPSDKDRLTISGEDLEFLSGEIPAAIAESLEGLQRVAAIVAAMKEFSHPGRTERSVLDLHQAIESTITVSRNEWKYVADVRTDFDDAVPRIPGLVGELNQVFLNLIVNAAQAIAARGDGEHKGSITVQTRLCEDVVEIRCADTGVGIPREIHDRIFDPFFTTKEVGKGTGQGLAVARSIIIDKHRGTIRCESEPGRGATFIIRLPLASTEAPSETAGVAAISEL